MRIRYGGTVYEISGVDFDRNEISFYNENGNLAWKKCDKIEIV
jgi:hypothetical protein